MKPITACATVFLILFASAVSRSGSVPPLINYQGVLTDASGQGISGTKGMEFNIYDAAIEGDKIWGPQVFSNIPVIDGRFNVILGSTDTQGRSIGDSFDSDQRFLGIKVDGGTEIVPRQQILSSPFAISADKAQTALNAELLQDKNLDEIRTEFKEPDYDSGWFDIATRNTYKKEIGFTGLPKHITAFYSRTLLVFIGMIYAFTISNFSTINDISSPLY